MGLGAWERRLVAGGVALGVVLGWAVLSPATAVERLRGLLASPWFPAALAALYLLRPFLAWPIVVLSALVGYRYGLLWGFPLALVGTAVTSLPPFLAARRVATGEGLLGTLAEGSQRYFGTVGGLRGVVAARLAPAPAEPVSAAAGAGGVTLPAFVLGTMVGEVPWTAAAVLAGASANRLTTATDAPGVDPLLPLAAVAVAGVLLAGPTYRYLRERGVL